MTDTPDIKTLSEAANAAGYGSGKRHRDMLAAKAQRLRLLPDPAKTAPVFAQDDMGYLVPICHFGNSTETGKDWGLYHDGHDDLTGTWGHDAKSDAETVAAILNSYAAGDLLPAAEVEARVQAAVAAERDRYQGRALNWLVDCFGEVIAYDGTERNHRFLEEALELVQSTGCTASEAHQLVDYVFGRNVGEPMQEVGGVMNTLAALCSAFNMDMMGCADAEMNRVERPEMMAKIKAKQAAKPKHSPLPEHIRARGDSHDG